MNTFRLRWNDFLHPKTCCSACAFRDSNTLPGRLTRLAQPDCSVEGKFLVSEFLVCSEPRLRSFRASRQKAKPQSTRRQHEGGRLTSFVSFVVRFSSPTGLAASSTRNEN